MYGIYQHRHPGNWFGSNKLGLVGVGGKGVYVTRRDMGQESEIQVFRRVLSI